MLDAGLPPPQPVGDFVQCMKDLNEDKAPAVREDLFDGAFEKEVNAKGRGTKSVHKTAVKLVLNFDALRALKGIQLANLDSRVEQFAKYVIDVRPSTGHEAQQKKILQKHVEFCGDNYLKPRLGLILLSKEPAAPSRGISNHSRLLDLRMGWGKQNNAFCKCGA